MAITKTNAMRRLDAAKIPYRVMEYTVDENDLYCFRFTGIAPHKMGDFVLATVSASYGENLTDTVTNDKVSIKGYADALRTEYAEDTAMLALLDNLLVYGAAAQVYMNYNLDNLVCEIGALENIPASPIILAGEANANVSIAACGLLLDGAFDLRVGIQATTLEKVLPFRFKRAIPSPKSLSPKR
jgi:hypothetical protein